MVASDVRVVDDRHGNGDRRHAGREHEVGDDGQVINPGQRGAGDGGELNVDGLVDRPVAEHRDERGSGRFLNGVSRRAQRDRGIVIDNGEERIRQRDQRAAGRVGERQVDGPIGVGEGIGNDPDREGLGRNVAIGPEEPAARPGVIRLVDRRPVAREKIRGRRPETAVGPDHRDRHQARRFSDEIIRRAERNLARTRLVIDNRQHRRTLGGHPLNHRAARRVDEIGEIQVQRPVEVRGQVVEDGNGECLGGQIPVQPGQPIADRQIIATGQRGAVHGEIIHRHHSDPAAGAAHRDGRVGSVLIHAVTRRAETDDTVVVQNRHRRLTLGPERRGAARIQQGKNHDPIAIHQVIGHHLDIERFERLTRQIVQRPVGGQIIRVREERRRRAVHGGELHGIRPEQTAGAPDRDRHVRTVLRDRVVGHIKHKAAFAGVDAAVEPDQVVVRHAIKNGEPARRENLAVGLQRERGHEVIGPRTEVDGEIEQAAGLEPREPVAIAVLDILETAADEHRPVGLHRERTDELIGTGRGIETAVRRTIRVQPCNPPARHTRDGGEDAADQHPAAGVHQDAVDLAIGPGARIEILVERAIGIQAGYMVAGDSLVLGEVAADEDQIVVNRHRADDPVSAAAEIERRIERAVIVQPGDEIPGHSADRREVTGHDDAPIILDRQRRDIVIGSDAGIEARINGAVDSQPREVGAAHPVDRVEHAADQHAVDIGSGQINRQRPDRRVGAEHTDRAGVKGRIHRAVGIQPGDVEAAGSIIGREIAPDQNHAVGVQANRKDGRIGREAAVEITVNRTTGTLIIHDADGRIGQAQGGTAGDIEQPDTKSHIATIESVVTQRHAERGRRLAVGEGQ